MRRAIFAVSGLLVVVYFSLVVSPFPQSIGRQHPELAAFLSPPSFNFQHSYTDGAVLGLRIGSSRAELKAFLEREFAKSGVLIPTCGLDNVGQKGPAVEVFSQEAAELLGRDDVCLHVPSRHIMLIATFDGDVVTSIDLTRVTIGL